MVVGGVKEEFWLAFEPRAFVNAATLSVIVSTKESFLRCLGCMPENIGTAGGTSYPSWIPQWINNLIVYTSLCFSLS